MKFVQLRVSEENKPNENRSIALKESYYRKLLLREIFLTKCGIKKDVKKDYCLCDNHKMKEIEKYIKVKHKGKDITLTYKMTVPTGEGVWHKINKKTDLS